MEQRARPPHDITPHEFFTVWVPASVERDENRRRRLGDTDASLLFVVHGSEAGGEFTLRIEAGRVHGRSGRTPEPDLEVRVDLETWRRLNQGDLSAPEALLRRRVHLSGNFVLALKLHLILG